MAECKHEQHMLMGTADGIVCRGCGKLFHSMGEIRPAAVEAPKEEPKNEPKKAGRRKK